MADQTPYITQNSINSATRHVVSYTAGFVTSLVGVAGIAAQLHAGNITADQVATLKTAGEALVSGVTSVAGALGTMASVGMGVWAWFASRPSAQSASLVKNVPGTTIVTTPALAASVPSAHVVSSADSAVVAK